MVKKPLIWEAYEFSYREKTSDWYWTIWIVAISVAAISIIYANILFAGVLIVGTFTLSVFGGKPPRKIRYEINERGVVMNKIMYPYLNLDSFGIDTYIPEMPKLVIKSKKKLMSFIIIPIGSEDEDTIRKFLWDHLPEEAHEEPFSQKVLEYLGF